MIDDIKVYTDEEETLSAALERLTDEWIDKWLYCDQTVADLRDACRTLTAHLAAATERAEKAERQNVVMREALKEISDPNCTEIGFNLGRMARGALKEVDGEFA